MFNRLTIPVLCFVAVLAPAALADDTMKTPPDGDDQMQKAPPADGDPASPPKRGKGGDRGALKGPKVPDGALEGDGKFGDRMKGGRGAGGPMNAMAQGRIMREALKSVQADISPDNWTKIEASVKGFEESMQTWKTEHADDIKALEEQFKAAREGGTKPTPELVQKMDELRATAPSLDKVQKEVFALMSSETKTKFEAKVAEMRKGMNERGRARPDGKDGAGAKGGDRKPADAKSPPKQAPSGVPFQFDDDKTAPPAKNPA